MSSEGLRSMYQLLHSLESRDQDDDAVRSAKWTLLKNLVDAILRSDIPISRRDTRDLKTAKEFFDNNEYSPENVSGENFKTNLEIVEKVRDEVLYTPSGGVRRKSQTARFCGCIKSVRKTLKARKGSTKEQGAIAVCVRSVLHTRGKTIKKFKCGKKMRVVTQKRK